MLRAAFVLLLLFAPAAGAWAQRLPVVRAVAVTPEPASRLADGQNLSVRVAYESDQPLCFQAAGYYLGRMHTGLSMNPSPVHPAGKGEAIVWLFGPSGTRIDEIRVRVYDAKWTPISELPVKVVAEWQAGAPQAPEAPWAREMFVAQQRAISKEVKGPPVPATPLEKIWFTSATLFTPLAFVCVPAYPLLQAYALRKLRGRIRLLSAAPLAFMVPAYAFSLFALFQKSNLWSLYTVYASPVAFSITLVVVVLARRRARREAA